MKWPKVDKEEYEIIYPVGLQNELRLPIKHTLHNFKNISAIKMNI